MRTTANQERFPARGNDGSNTYLVSPSGTIIASLYPSNTPETFLQNALTIAATNDMTPLGEPLPSGETGYVIYTALPDSGSKLMSIISDSNLPSLRGSTLQTVVLLASLGLLAMVLTINTFVYRTVGRPIHRLGSTAQKIGAGDMSQVIEYQGNRDEIGVMARALEEMRRDLQTSYDMLEQRVEERTTELNIARQMALSTAGELRAVYDESLSVVTDHRLDTLLDSFAQRILTLLHADYCGVWLLRSSGHEIRLVAHTTNDESLTGTTVPLGQGLVGLVTQTARPVMVDDYGTWPNLALHSTTTISVY
jgi:HAMP domain-containing protein